MVSAKATTARSVAISHSFMSATALGRSAPKRGDLGAEVGIGRELRDDMVDHRFSMCLGDLAVNAPTIGAARLLRFDVLQPAPKSPSPRLSLTQG